VNSTTEALIAHLKLEIEKLRRELYGSSSEHFLICISSADGGRGRFWAEKNLILSAELQHPDLAARFRRYPDPGRRDFDSAFGVGVILGVEGAKLWGSAPSRLTSPSRNTFSE
jgi:hypothetical protein